MIESDSAFHYYHQWCLEMEDLYEQEQEEEEEVEDD